MRCLTLLVCSFSVFILFIGCNSKPQKSQVTITGTEATSYEYNGDKKSDSYVSGIRCIVLPYNRRDEYASMLSVAFNMVSTNKKIIKPKRDLDNSSIIVNLKDYGIDNSVWNRMFISDVVSAESVLELLTRADAGDIKKLGYYRILHIENSLDFQRLTMMSPSIDMVTVTTATQNTALPKRKVSCSPTVYGAVWSIAEYTVDATTGKDHLVQQSFAGNLPNGLPVYMACDDKEKLVDWLNPATSKFSPIDGVFDQRVRVSSGCFGCHMIASGPHNLGENDVQANMSDRLAHWDAKVRKTVELAAGTTFDEFQKTYKLIYNWKKEKSN